MANNIFLSNELMRNSECSKCNNYLSVPPIVITSLSKNPICGRCVKNGEYAEENRAYFYEDLAAFMFFPCVNDIYGCSVKTPWGKVLNHEVNCKFSRMVCPIIDCNIEIGSDVVIPHCEGNHEEYIVGQNNYPLSNTENSCQINKLFIWKNRPFIIQTKAENEDFFLRISSVQEAGPASFKCILHGKEASYSVCLNEFKIMRYTSKFPDFSVTEKIDISAWKKVLGTEIQCTLNFDDEKFDMDNDKMVSELECPVCTHYMKPPISMCSVGHSLCQKCRKMLPKCPSCSNDFTETRNYSLEKISEIVTHPRNYKDQDSNFQDFEVNCFLNDLVPCTWRGTYSEAFQHISLLHPDNSLVLQHYLSLDLSTLTTKKWFLLYDNRIFVLHIKHEIFSSSRIIRWVISYITNNLKDVGHKYMFYLDILRDNRVFRINEVCRPILENHSQNNSIYVSLPVSLINSFIRQNNITFTLNIAKFG